MTETILEENTDTPSDADEIIEENPEDENLGTDTLTDTEDGTALDLESDITEIKNELPGANAKYESLCKNERYKELRSLGLTPGEAYLATSVSEKRVDSRAHLTGGFPKAASAPPSVMSNDDLNIARSLFEDLNDSEIKKLYKKVTK